MFNTGSIFKRKKSQSQDYAYQYNQYTYNPTLNYTESMYYHPTQDMMQYQYYYQYYDYSGRACTGIDYLDHLLHGGFRRGEVYLIAGEAGMGKTIFAIQFLKAGADRDEIGMYITVDEPSEDVKKGVKEAVGWDLDTYESSGRLVLTDFRTHFRIYSREEKVIIDPRDLAKLIIENVKKYNVRRLVIDPIAPLLITSHQDILWVREYMRELIFQLKRLKEVTTIITSEIPTGEEKISRFGVEEYLASGVITLSLTEIEGKIFRIMFIRKMRWTPIRPVKLVFDIQTQRGIVIIDKLENFVKKLKHGVDVYEQQYPEYQYYYPYQQYQYYYHQY